MSTIDNRSRPANELVQRKPDTKPIVHPTDDLGWPICNCVACCEKRDRMSARFWSAFMAGYDLDQLQRNPAGEFDYDGDGGREHVATLRASHPNNRLGHWRQIGDAVPHIESPSIVPDGDIEP
jgi:hypothetical protein